MKYKTAQKLNHTAIIASIFAGNTSADMFEIIKSDETNKLGKFLFDNLLDPDKNWVAEQIEEMATEMGML